MPGRKSDRATIEARQHRLAELLSDGMTAAQASEVLREEGYPASHDTVQNDVADMVELVKENKLRMIIDAQIKANARLQELEDDVEQALLNKQISLKDRVAMALDILKQRRELLGLDQPRKTESKNVHLNLDAVDPATLPEYRRWLYETRFMNAEQKEKAFQLIRESGLNVRQIAAVEVPTSSPLWDEQPKKLEDGNDAS